MLRDAVARYYERKVDLPPSACLPYKVEEAASGSEPMGVGSMTEVCEGLAEIFSTLKKLEETRAQLAVEVVKRRVSKAKPFLSLVVTARYVISGLWPLQVEEKLSFRRLVKLLTIKRDTALKVPRELSKSLMVFTLTAIDDLVPIIYRL